MEWNFFIYGKFGFPYLDAGILAPTAKVAPGTVLVVAADLRETAAPLANLLGLTVVVLLATLLGRVLLAQTRRLVGEGGSEIEPSDRVGKLETLAKKVSLAKKNVHLSHLIPCRRFPSPES